VSTTPTNHTHEPAEAIVAFFHTCRHCGVEIEPVMCCKCDGTGHAMAMLHSSRECRQCGGSGVGRWMEVKP
jgi:hypothetical protein